LGGADDDNVNLKILAALAKARLPDVEVAVIIGPVNPHRLAVETFASSLDFPVQIVSNPANVAEWMVWADVGVAAAGITTWEMAFLGLPMLLLSAMANQIPIAEGFQDAGAAVNLGWHENMTALGIADEISALFRSVGRRATMSDRARALVDGCGAARVVEFLRGETRNS
jgi:spore coat polysaccharide biosynthesis predicted glycosyltransferase SpsG